MRRASFALFAQVLSAATETPKKPSDCEFTFRKQRDYQADGKINGLAHSLHAEDAKLRVPRGAHIALRTLTRAAPPRGPARSSRSFSG